MTTSVFYPPRSAPALGYLKASANDIEVFVEDSACPNMWVKLLKCFLPVGTRLNSVNNLGSRKNVLAACRSDQAADGRKKIYIIDADLDLIRGAPKPNLKHLYRLRAYCSENYLLQENSLIEIATTFSTDCSTEEAKNKLNFSGWMMRNGPHIARLFAYYAVAHSVTPGIKTISYSVYKLRDDTKAGYNICSKKVNKRIFGLTREMLRMRPKGEIRGLLIEYLEVTSEKSVTTIASGKDYILPFVYEELKRLFGVSIRRDTLKVMLASYVDPIQDPYLSRRLSRIMK